MSTAVMALAETSKAYQRKIKELEDEVARLQTDNLKLTNQCYEYNRDLTDERVTIQGLRANNGKLDWEVKKLRLDCSEARGYGQALYECLRKAYDGLGQVPQPPWLVGE